MTLKNKILLNKFLVPTMLLVVLIIYVLSQNYLEFGFIIYYLILWLIVSLFLFYKQKNHLIEYNAEPNELKIKYYTGINKTAEKIIQIDKIVSNKLETRMFDFGFDVLSIKYIDEQNLYDLIDLRVNKKEDWIDILTSIKTKAE
ncbi:hypothetical protein DFQ11_10966 [Winogradskyella epiphytica]|uniref:Uncharacterized protein n=2 Tax=Flavobacteriaceae TaxID=49546 RepID=A0A2V4XWH1_9FLAO|nr:hypothetical protein [Oceanihabitans sediminis]PYE79679.1 hypothetical protein DFQ11_10966 [Winogradskyella epiphytica]RBP26933.1 hypothetical protein DFR65_1133 [Oceanihabitans sediminis]RCU56971.1 hypothetical protein DU428_08455 [Oceanihabitans sediminis]GGW73410.1 hypothetical protein GCM10008085_27010 [Winogradskyella epiphytica]